jgi:ABC-type polar amino acid transport system ATPase subunit
MIYSLYMVSLVIHYTPYYSKIAITMRLNTGMVFQDFNLFPHMCALDNVIEGLVTVKKIPKDKAIPIGMKYL